MWQYWYDLPWISSVTFIIIDEEKPDLPHDEGPGVSTSAPPHGSFQMLSTYSFRLNLTYPSPRLNFFPKWCSYNTTYVCEWYPSSHGRSQKQGCRLAWAGHAISLALSQVCHQFCLSRLLPLVRGGWTRILQECWILILNKEKEGNLLFPVALWLDYRGSDFYQCICVPYVHHE